jgi:hypothetical protein
MLLATKHRAAPAWPPQVGQETRRNIDDEARHRGATSAAREQANSLTILDGTIVYGI